MITKRKNKPVCRALWCAAALVCLLGTGCTKEEREEPAVPEAVQAFCTQWFPEERIREAVKEGSELRVRMCRGTLLLFDEKNEWTSIENLRRPLPRALAAAPVQEWLDDNRPSAEVLLLERRTAYTVGLDTQELLLFDDGFRVTIKPWKTVDHGVELD